MAMFEIIVFGVGLLVALFIGYQIGVVITALRKEREWKHRAAHVRKDAITRSRAVLGGQFSEQLAPYLPDFPYSPTEVRFLGKPIDFIVFSGMDAKDISEVVFVEVKSGDAKLSAQERHLRDAVEGGRVRYEEYRVPHRVTRR